MVDISRKLRSGYSYPTVPVCTLLPSGSVISGNLAPSVAEFISDRAALTFPELMLCDAILCSNGFYRLQCGFAKLVWFNLIFSVVLGRMDWIRLDLFLHGPRISGYGWLVGFVQSADLARFFIRDVLCHEPIDQKI
jgi:hypothetical protein